jgi:hypothetical protein
MGRVSDQDASDTAATDAVFTPDDVQRLNRMAIERATAFARIAGTASIVIGAVLGLAWAWFAVRTQQRASFSVFGGSDDDLDFVDRVDLFVNTLSLLVFATVICAIGVALRLFADYIQDRSGSSITGYAAGDELPVEEFELVAKLEP